MARLLYAKDTFDSHLDQVNFSLARLEDDTLTLHIAERLALWIQWILEVEVFFRQISRDAVRISAARVGANEELDRRVKHFGSRLELAVGGNRESGRWRGFFREPVSDFVRQPLEDEVRTVKGWLGSSDPEVVAALPHLSPAVARVERALDRDADLAKRRGDLWTAREELADRLNAARRKLEGELEDIAMANDLPKSWVASFFQVGTSSGGAPPAEG